MVSRWTEVGVIYVNSIPANDHECDWKHKLKENLFHISTT